MADARDEARRRIAEVLITHHRYRIQDCRCGWNELGKSHAVHVADAVLSLFPDGEWGWAGWDEDDPDRGMALRDEAAARQVVAEHVAAGQSGVRLVRRLVGPWEVAEVDR